MFGFVGFVEAVGTVVEERLGALLDLERPEEVEVLGDVWEAREVRQTLEQVLQLVLGQNMVPEVEVSDPADESLGEILAAVTGLVLGVELLTQHHEVVDNPLDVRTRQVEANAVKDSIDVQIGAAIGSLPRLDDVNPLIDGNIGLFGEFDDVVAECVCVRVHDVPDGRQGNHLLISSQLLGILDFGEVADGQASIDRVDVHWGPRDHVSPRHGRGKVEAAKLALAIAVAGATVPLGGT